MEETQDTIATDQPRPREKPWVWTEEDIRRVAVTESADKIEFMPEGFVGPIRFEAPSSCGVACESIFIDTWDSRANRFAGGGVMTHEQARRLHAWLGSHLAKLTDQIGAVGDPIKNCFGDDD